MSDKNALIGVPSDTVESLTNYAKALTEGLSELSENTSKASEMLEGHAKGNLSQSLVDVFDGLVATVSDVVDQTKEVGQAVIDELQRQADQDNNASIQEQADMLKAAFDAVEIPAYRSPQLSTAATATMVTEADTVNIISSLQGFCSQFTETLSSYTGTFRELEEKGELVSNAFIESHNSNKVKVADLGESLRAARQNLELLRDCAATAKKNVHSKAKDVTEATNRKTASRLEETQKDLKSAASLV